MNKPLARSDRADREVSPGQHEVEHVDVLIVGAGLSGIAAAHYVQTECPWASYAIVEARGSLGGTWDLFRYPGIRSDSDMFTFGYSFRPWQRPEAMAAGDTILTYLKETAAQEGIDRHIRYGMRVVSADWSTDNARWTVTLDDATSDQPVTLSCSFYFSCTGYYRYDHGYQPDFPGQDSFDGAFVHPQQWPLDLEFADKKIVVIGSGATAVTLVPSLAQQAAHVTMLQRSPTYVAAVPRTNPMAGAIRKVVPRRFRDSAVRWGAALSSQGFYQLSRRRPTLVKRILRRGAQRRLPVGYDVDRHFTPDYNPWDQRVCVVPDGDLFRAIRRGEASVVTDAITTFTSTGIALASGEHLDADIIVSATGLELLFLGGSELSVDGTPVRVPERLTYKGMMLEGVPNFALVIGYTNASWTLKAELTCRYVTRLLNHLHRNKLAQCVPINADPSLQEQPLLSLASGYIERAADRMPKQGSRAPWLVRQSYLRDYFTMKRARIDDGVMRFSRPAVRVGSERSGS